MNFCSKLSFVLITHKPSASSSCLRCDICSRRRVIQFSIYQNSITRKRADQTAQILRLTVDAIDLAYCNGTFCYSCMDALLVYASELQRKEADDCTVVKASKTTYN